MVSELLQGLRTQRLKLSKQASLLAAIGTDRCTIPQYREPQKQRCRMMLQSFGVDALGIIKKISLGLYYFRFSF